MVAKGASSSRLTKATKGPRPRKSKRAVYRMPTAAELKAANIPLAYAHLFRVTKKGVKPLKRTRIATSKGSVSQWAKYRAEGQGRALPSILQARFRNNISRRTFEKSMRAKLGITGQPLRKGVRKTNQVHVPFKALYKYAPNSVKAPIFYQTTSGKQAVRYPYRSVKALRNIYEVHSKKPRHWGEVPGNRMVGGKYLRLKKKLIDAVNKAEEYVKKAENIQRMLTGRKMHVEKRKMADDKFFKGARFMVAGSNAANEYKQKKARKKMADNKFFKGARFMVAG